MITESKKMMPTIAGRRCHSGDSLEIYTCPRTIKTMRRKMIRGKNLVINDERISPDSVFLIQNKTRSEPRRMTRFVIKFPQCVCKREEGRREYNVNSRKRILRTERLEQMIRVKRLPR